MDARQNVTIAQYYLEKQTKIAWDSPDAISWIESDRLQRYSQRKKKRNSPRCKYYLNDSVGLHKSQVFQRLHDGDIAF